MDRSATLSAHVRRRRRIVLVGLLILGVAIAASVVRRSHGAPAPRSSSTDVAQTTSRQTTPDGPLEEADGVLDQRDGVIPDGAAISVFDEEIPAVGRLDPELLVALRRATTDAEADGVGLQVESGWRSPEYQQRLLRDAVAEHGSQEAAARWVATAETSAHVSGEAVDIGPSAAAAWLSERGAAYGLCQVYGNEPWHYELRPDAVEGGCPPKYANPTEDPRMQP